MDIHELEQELQIRTEQNADLYAKLCNALMQLEEANKAIIDSYEEALYCESWEIPAAKEYIDKWRIK